jgi:hypothetical protein
MQTHQIQVLGARQQVHEIRGELFAFPEVIEVFVKGRPDFLVVVYAGRPRPGEWLCALRRLGYRTPSRSRAGWPRPRRQAKVILRDVVHCKDVGVDDGDRTTKSIGNEPASRGRRDAA